MRLRRAAVRRERGNGRGFNRGIRYVLDSGPEDYVLLLDQNSVATPGVVAELAADRAGRAVGLRIAAVGPMLGDVNETRDAGGPGDASGLLTVETLASSGTLLHWDVLGAVGLMDEELFIDAVDHEWCLRVQSRGLTSYVMPSAKLAQNTGDRLVRILARPRPLHDNPVWHYYIVRNSLLLPKRPYLSRAWKACEFALTVRRIIGYSLLSSRRAQTVRYIALAVLRAGRGRSGEFRGR